MGSALRPGTIACVAVAGAGLILTVPPAAPSPGVGVRALDLVASPIDPYIDLVTNTFANLTAIGTHWLEDPLPTLTQAIVNWFGYLQSAVDSFTAAGQAFVDGLANLPDQLHTLLSAVTDSDFEAVIAQLVIIALSINPIPALVDHLVAIPYAVAGNVVNAALAALHAAQVPIGLAAISAVHATVAEAESAAKDFIDDLQAGELAGALTQLVETPAQILDAAFNNDAPGLAGLFTPFQNVHQTGLVDALVNYLPRTVAQTIGALYAPINDTPNASGLDALNSTPDPDSDQLTEFVAPPEFPAPI